MINNNIGKSIQLSPISTFSPMKQFSCIFTFFPILTFLFMVVNEPIYIFLPNVVFSFKSVNFEIQHN